MKKVHSLVSITLAMILAAGMLSACAGGSAGSSSESSDPLSSAATQSAPADGSDGEAGEAPVELSVMGWQPDLAMLNDKMIPAIQEKYPHITIKAQILDWFAYWEKLTIETAAGQAPDIAVLDVDHIPTYMDYYRPLEDLAAQVMGADWQTRFNDSVLDSLKVADDTIRLLPTDTTGLWYLFYNKTLCDELNVAAPTGNYDEIVQWITQVNAAGNDTLPIAFAGKEDVNVGFFWLWLASNIKQGVVADAAAGDASFTDEPFVLAFAQLQEMMENGFMDEKVFGLDAYPGADDLFKNRKAVSYLTGQWSLGGYLIGSQVGGTGIENDELGVVVLQNVAGGQTVMQKYVAMGFGVSNDCAHPEDAMRVIEEWSTGQAAQEWMNYQACVPAAKTVTLSMDLMKTQEAKNTAGDALDALNSNPSVLRSTLNSALDTKIGQLVVSVLRMGMSPDEALAQMQQAADDLRE